MASAVPGDLSTPDCGKATICMSTSSRKRSRTRARASTWDVPRSGSTSAWLRMAVVPWPMQSRTRLDARSAAGGSSWRQVFSPSMRLMRSGPAR